MAQYGKTAYWDERYTKDPETFDWYQRYQGPLKDIINENISKESNILMAGCGSSKLSVEMIDDGFQSITNIDISKIVIDQNIERYKNKPEMKWSVMNILSLDFQDQTFDAVIAKATYDAILCGENSTANITKLCSEVSRVLKNDGIFLIVSYGTPESRKPILDKEEVYNWKVDVVTIPKPTISASSLPTADDASGFHYIYLCKKTGSSLTN